MRLHKFRSSYWSNSKLAHNIYTWLNIPKPDSATAEEWDEWNIAVETKYPTLHWIVDKLFNGVQDVLHFPLDLVDSIRVYLRNRYVLKTHMIKTGLEIGQWHEVENQILHGCFSLLVDFVECQKANMHVWSQKEADQPLWRRFPLLRWGQYRSKEDGIAYLKWEMSLTHDGVPDRQALDAVNIYNLYVWWTETRPKRKDAYELAGWNKFEEDHPIDRSVFRLTSNRTPEEQQELSDIFKRVRIIEEQYDQEDDEMLMKLMQIRRGMWT